MWNYVLIRYYAFIDGIRLTNARKLADSYSSVYNDQRVAVFINVGLNMRVNNGKILLVANKRYIFMNRKGFLLAQRRGMFVKESHWTAALGGCVYSTK